MGEMGQTERHFMPLYALWILPQQVSKSAQTLYVGLGCFFRQYSSAVGGGVKVHG